MKQLKHSLFLVALISFYTNAQNSPRISIIFVIDAFAHHYIEKLKPNLKGGIKFLLDSGIIYENAFFPHGLPGTGPGHTALSTGAFAKDHGIIGNLWYDKAGNKIHCDDDSVDQAAVFTQEGLGNYGKSANNILADTLADQIILRSENSGKKQIFSLSLKSRAAIATAGKFGKAIWFDSSLGMFTSSKAYFDKLPDWISSFNKKHKIDQMKEFTWSLFYSKDNPAYQFKNASNYEYAGWKVDVNKQGLAGKTTKIVRGINEKKPYRLFIKSPHSNQLLMDLAQQCFDNYLSTELNDSLFLWIDISSLDKLTHTYGPDSLEALDLIYHIDAQINKFIQHVIKKVKNENDILFVLTADHGVMPIPELLQEQGLANARRIKVKPLMHEINEYIKEKYGFDNAILNFRIPQFFLNEPELDKLNNKKGMAIVNEIKMYLKKQSGIRNVWTFEELNNATFEKNQPEYLLKNQLYPGRSGMITCQAAPYTLLTKYDTGTSHTAPYDYDTHVPLIIYQKGIFEGKKIADKVWTTQLACTLANILKVPRPSACTFEVLPAIL